MQCLLKASATTVSAAVAAACFLVSPTHWCDFRHDASVCCCFLFFVFAGELRSKRGFGKGENGGKVERGIRALSLSHSLFSFPSKKRGENLSVHSSLSPVSLPPVASFILQE